MATPKYIFSSNNSQLLVELDNSSMQWENDEISSYRESSIDLYNNKIQLYDYGRLKKEFLLENIKTISGSIPTDISNAYTLLTTLITA